MLPTRYDDDDDDVYIKRICHKLSTMVDMP